MIKRTGIALAGLTVTKEAFAFAATASVAAVALAPAIGFDPWTWVLGAFGGTAAQAFLPSDPPKPKTNTFMKSCIAWLHGRRINFLVVIISIILAGIGSEYVVRIFIDQGWTVPNIYIASFVMSSVWPFIAQLAWKKALKWSET